VREDLNLRDEYIAQVVPGKTFADVGGLWGTKNEKISVAHQHGATALTMIDILPFEAELWQEFYARMESLSITDYKCISTDICDLKVKESIDVFDVVHCSGVLYHHPNPMLMLTKLHDITNKYLILTSAITQEVIENRKGRYTLPPSAVLFVPALSDEEREVLKVYWREDVGIPVARGIIDKVPYFLTSHGPWWWLPTAQALLTMCEIVGFKIISHDLTWRGNAVTALLQV